MFHLLLFAFLFQPTICQTPDWLRLFTRNSNRRLPNSDDLTLRGVSLEECARRCVEEPAFVCRSFDYTASVQTCHLSRNDRHSTGTGLDSTATGVNYYEKRNTVVDVAIINQYPLVPYPDAGRTFWTCRANGAVLGTSSHDTYFFRLEYVYRYVNSGRFTANRNSNKPAGKPWGRVNVPTTDNADTPTTDPIGVYYCEGEQGTRRSRAFTIKMSKSAQVKPTAPTFTASLGDPVTLTVSGSSDGVAWEKRDVSNRLAAGTDLTVTTQATEAHQGSYVLYRQADGYTGNALVGVTRLIVRGCPQNKYGPDCRFTCPTCHHGGWCDDVSGDCVCPPGFMGKNCEIGCPRINYGQSCQWDCNNADIDGDNDDPDCRRVMLCLPDPYGCSCARGWKGLDCQTQCTAGEYGAGCTQRCACQNGGVCDSVKGCVCVDDWSGPTCEDKKFRLVIDPPSLHITRATSDAEVTVTCSCHPWGEDDCPALTVEPVNGGQAPQSLLRFPDQANSRWKALRFTPEQKLGTLGFRCSDGSTYQESTEFRVTGMSPRVARFSTMPSSTNAAPVELNAGTDVTFVCETAGDPLPQTSDVTLTFSSRSPALPTQMAIAGGNTVHSRLLRNVSVTDAGQYVCMVSTVAGQDSRMVSIDVKVPPTTTVPPPVRATSTTELAVNIQLSKLAWTGDGEIIAKDVQYKRANESSWETLASNEEGEVRIGNLSPNTTYNVRLVLSRPGEGGRGKPGPIATVSTPKTMAALAQSSAGAIAGGVIAALLLLLLLAGVGLFLWRRNGSPSPRLVKEKKKTANPSARPPEPPPRPDLPVEDGGLLETNPYRVQIDALPDYVHQLGPDGLKKEFATISDHRHPYAVSKLQANVAKNRYKNIVSYDHSRVVLEDQPGRANSDYINASYIDGYDKVKAFIACQGPKPDTSRDMWRMVWQERSACVVMVTNLVENGRTKCERYWPEESNEYENNVQTYGDITVTAEKVSTMADYALRLLHIQKAGVDEVREVQHFQYTSWPDYGVPKHPTSTINFVKRVKASIPRGAGPPIVHCSAGVGRSGTFITIAAMLDMIETEGAINVHDFVDAMRENRMTMVQTPDQYAFIYTALLEATQCGNTTIPADEFRDRFSLLSRKNPKTGMNACQEEFKKLARVCPPLTPDKTRSALSPANKNKNRSSSVLASDSNRPMLTLRAGDPPDADYINADFLDGYKRKDAFLVTQSPLPGTVTEFWRMLSDHRSFSVIMLNQLNPKDKSVVKYWPDEGRKTFGNLEVEMVSESREKSAIVRQFKLSSETRFGRQSDIVHQFEFTSWPSGRSTPISVDDLLELLGLVEKWQQKSGNGPITVHCINGVGRSGVFCTAHAMLDRLKTEQVVDVFQAVKTLRNHRPNMVETEEQYQFCYQVALAYLASFDTYANFK